MRLKILFTSLLCGIHFILISQTTFTSNNYASVNDSFTVSSVGILSSWGTDFDTTGQNIVWDYGSLTANSQRWRKFIDPDNTSYEALYWTLCYENCVSEGGGLTACITVCSNKWDTIFNLAEHKKDSINLGVLTLNDIHEFYKIDSNKLEKRAVGATVYGAPIVFEYNEPDVIYHFPLDEGNIDTSYSSFELDLYESMSFYYAHKQVRVNHINGWGTLTTPYQTYDSTLKVTSTIYATDTIVWEGDTLTLSALLPEELVPDSIIEYKWFTPDMGIPVLSVKGLILNGKVLILKADFIDSLQCFDPEAIFGYLPFPTYLNPDNDSVNVDFYSLAMNSDLFTWDFGDSGNPSFNSSSAQHPNHWFTKSGTYLVSLTTCNSACNPVVCDTFSLPVLVIDTTEIYANFTYTPLFPCVGDTVFFTNMSANDTAWYWVFDDGTVSTDENPYFIFDTAGTQEVVLMSMNTIGSDTIVKEIKINELVDASFAYSDSISQTPITFSNTSTGTDTNSAFIWIFVGAEPNPAYSVEENPSVTFNDDGYTFICLSAWNSLGCKQTTCDFLYITKCLDAGFSPDSYIECVGDTITFSNTSVGLGNSNYTWFANENVFSTDSTAQFMADSAGTYVITLVADNGICSDTVSTSIKINEMVNAGEDASICLGDTVSLKAVGGGILSTYTWTPSATLSCSKCQTPQAYPEQTTTYMVSVNILQAGCGISQDSITVFVDSLHPDANFGYSINASMVEFYDSSSYTTSYYWDFGDGNSSGDKSPTHTYSDTGTYQVTLISSNDCGKDSIEKFLTISQLTGVENQMLDNEDYLNIYPNPTSGDFKVSFFLPESKKITLKICDISGKELFTIKNERMDAGQHLISISNLKDFNPGSYLFIMSTDEKEQIQPFNLIR